MNQKSKQILFEIHSNNPREGPGNFESTKRAYSMLVNFSKHPIIMDVGCGPGQQTLDLAELSEGEIYAIDTHQPYLDALQKKIIDRNLSDRIFVKQGDMASLEFDHEFFDLIWAEGSIYLIGFEKGLKLWQPFLKPKGYIAVTDMNWLKDNPPSEIVEFWNNEYPWLDRIDNNLSIIQRLGYQVIGHFTLPPNAWWDDYYYHIEQKIQKLKLKYNDDPEALEILNHEKKEIDIFKKYSDYYGYVFYVMQKGN